eukprot:Rmarinus@m.16796
MLICLLYFFIVYFVVAAVAFCFFVCFYLFVYSLESLKRRLEREKAQDNDFSDLPFHYLEIASLLFEFARDDFQNPDSIEAILQDIEDVRFNKIRNGLKQLEGATAAVKLNHVAAMEMNRIRRMTMTALDQYHTLERKEEEAEVEPRAPTATERRALDDTQSQPESQPLAHAPRHPSMVQRDLDRSQGSEDALGGNSGSESGEGSDDRPAKIRRYRR